jgi:hypothetical protein
LPHGIDSLPHCAYSSSSSNNEPCTGNGCLAGLPRR